MIVFLCFSMFLYLFVQSIACLFLLCIKPNPFCSLIFSCVCLLDLIVDVLCMFPFPTLLSSSQVSGCIASIPISIVSTELIGSYVVANSAKNMFCNSWHQVAYLFIILVVNTFSSSSSN